MGRMTYDASEEIRLKLKVRAVLAKSKSWADIESNITALMLTDRGETESVGWIRGWLECEEYEKTVVSNPEDFISLEEVRKEPVAYNARDEFAFQHAWVAPLNDPNPEWKLRKLPLKQPPYGLHIYMTKKRESAK
jgi:hypothetical protein